MTLRYNKEFTNHKTVCGPEAAIGPSSALFLTFSDRDSVYLWVSHGLDTDTPASVINFAALLPSCSFLVLFNNGSSIVHGCSVLSARLHHGFLMVDGRASALYEPEQNFLNNCELSSTERWTTVTIGSTTFRERVSAITQTSNPLKP